MDSVDLLNSADLLDADLLDADLLDADLLDADLMNRARAFLGPASRGRRWKPSSAEELIAEVLERPFRQPDAVPAATPTAAAGAGVSLPQAVLLLRAAREEQGLSLEDLHLESGISRGRLCRIENRVEVNPTIGTLDRIAEALGLRLLVTLEDRDDRQNDQGEMPK